MLKIEILWAWIQGQFTILILNGGLGIRTPGPYTNAKLDHKLEIRTDVSQKIMTILNAIII